MTITLENIILTRPHHYNIVKAAHNAIDYLNHLNALYTIALHLVITINSS